MVNTSGHKNPYKHAHHAVPIMPKMLKIFIPLSQYLGPASADSSSKRTGIKPYVEYTCSPALDKHSEIAACRRMPLMALIICASRPWAIKALKIYVKTNDSALN